jgi:hypothetical protein
MKNLILILTICFLSNSCGFKGYDQSYEMTVTVLDMDGKPVKGRKVKALAGFEFHGTIPSGKVTGTATTDANGQAVLNYTLSVWGSGQDYATITTEDDALFKCTNVLTHISDNKQSSTIKKTGTLTMDSLVPFRIRFKTNRDDATSVGVLINNEKNLHSDLTINTVFLKNTLFISTPKVDTIISTMVYSKARFTMLNSMNFKNQPVNISKGLTVVFKFEDRSSVYLQEF